jgi:hypothetical protein
MKQSKIMFVLTLVAHILFLVNSTAPDRVRGPFCVLPKVLVLIPGIACVQLPCNH